MAGQLQPVESRREQAQKNAEAQRSVHEAQGNRQVGYSRWDDRRDARDDIKEARREAEQSQRLYNISVELNSLAGRFDNRALNRKRDLMRSMLKEATRDYHESRRELREDRKELREDVR